ncbi:cache domain-containing protein [Leucobacter sp. GX24907]
MSETSFDLNHAASEAWSVFETAFSSMEPLAQFVETLTRNALERNGALRTSDFEALKPELLKNLVTLPEPVIGSCFGFGVGVLEDITYFMPGLERDASGVRDASHNLDPMSDTFYDYSELDWLAPFQRDFSHVQGPYIDLGGTNKFTITASLPVQVDEQFIGKLGVDVGLEAYERSLVPLLDRAPGSLAILNAENRVVVSNDAARPTGSLPTVDPNHLTPCGDFGWHLYYLP